jgi:tRNA modification GTPase
MAPDDTIAAISTPPGMGGIAIVRMSGGDSLTIASKIFKGKTSPLNIESHRAIYGRIADPETNEEVDEVLIMVMRAPHSYTGEDCVEISCHGGTVPATCVLEACIKSGARMANGGEFTKRAFLNGRIDLTQAEAVIDIVSAKTKKGLKEALYRLDGFLSKRIRKLKESLVSIRKRIELSLDFPEADIGNEETTSIEEKVISVINIINDLIREGERVSILREGMSGAIIGKTNVGKSSLLNALLLEERAIVTPLPGTTRDVIEGWINIDGVPLKLYDTCGFRDAENIAEEMGIKKTKDAIDNTSFSLFITDGSIPLTDEDREIFSLAKEKPLIIVINKIDLPKRVDISEIQKNGDFFVCEVSAKEHTGIKELNRAITKLLGIKEMEVSGGLPTRTRHFQLLLQAKKTLENGLRGLRRGKSAELIAYDIREACQFLGEIIGEVTPEGIIDEIFRDFCIGK